MTTITLPRATVEQALEALSSIVVCLRSRNGTPVSVAFDEDKCEASITALRAALAPPSARQVSPAAFAEIVKSREEIVGVPVYWAQWPNKETP